MRYTVVVAMFLRRHYFCGLDCVNLNISCEKYAASTKTYQYRTEYNHGKRFNIAPKINVHALLMGGVMFCGVSHLVVILALSEAAIYRCVSHSYACRFVCLGFSLDAHAIVDLTIARSIPIY